MSKNNISLVLVFSTILATGVACGRFSQLTNNNAVNTGNSNNQSTKIGVFTLADKSWNTYDLEKSDIKIDLPAKPSDKTPSDAQLPAGYKQIIAAMSVHALDYSDFSIGASELSPTKKRKFTIKEVADTSMTAIKKQLPDLTYTLDIKSETNAKYNGSFTKNGKSFDLRGCAVYKKADPARMWAIIVFYDKTNDDARTAAKRAIDSVVFNGSTEECK